MHHLIFIPREYLVGVTTADHLSAVGLADHAVGALSTGSEGPDASGGMLFGWVHGRLHFNADEQTWFPAVPSGDLKAGRYHVGAWNDSPVKEADVRRPGTLFGDDVTLGDGAPWMIPAPAFLPHDMMLADDGSIRMEPKRRYQDVCLEASRWRSRLHNPDVRTVDYLDLWSFARRCLSLNYRMPAELASHLRLIDTDNVKTVVATAIRSEE